MHVCLSWVLPAILLANLAIVWHHTSFIIITCNIVCLEVRQCARRHKFQTGLSELHSKPLSQIKHRST